MNIYNSVGVEVILILIPTALLIVLMAMVIMLYGSLRQRIDEVEAELDKAKEDKPRTVCSAENGLK